MSVWFITGASRGLGAAIADEALSRSHQVVSPSPNHFLACYTAEPIRVWKRLDP